MNRIPCQRAESLGSTGVGQKNRTRGRNRVGFPKSVCLEDFAGHGPREAGLMVCEQRH